MTLLPGCVGAFGGKIRNCQLIKINAFKDTDGNFLWAPLFLVLIVTPVVQVKVNTHNTL